MAKLTDEQNNIIDVVCGKDSSGKVVAVNAVAGSGKTTTALEIVKAYNPKKAFYSAFNKAIVLDGSKKFGRAVECKTTHAFAFKYVKPKNIDNFTYEHIEENINFKQKRAVITCLDGYFRSNFIDIHDFIKTVEDVDGKLVIKYANKMLEEEIPRTFNYMLKHLHLLLASKQININYDLLLLDECQDTTGVSLEIFKLINAEKKIILGDTHQNIYSFMDTINAFDNLVNCINLNLTNSFRATTLIAETVEEYGKMFFTPNFKFNGLNKNLATPVTELYLTRSNAGLLLKAQELLESSKSFSLVRDINTLFELPEALVSAAAGRPVHDKRYKYLEILYREYTKENYTLPKKEQSSFYSYIATVTEDEELHKTVSLLMLLRQKKIDIFTLKKTIRDMIPNGKVVLSTVHTYKGLEADTVYLEKEFKNSITTNSSIEELNIYYTAMTRAKLKLYGVDYIKIGENNG